MVEFNLISIDEAILDSSKIVTVLSIPYKYIRVMVNNIKTSCLEKGEDGVLKLNSWMKTVALQYNYLVNKTNINLKDGDMFENFDKLRESGILNTILNVTNRVKEYDVILNILNEEIEEELRLNKFELQFNWQKENSAEAQIKKFLDMILSKVPDEKTIKDLLKSVKKDFKNFDISKLNFLNNKLQEFGEKPVPSSEQVDTMVDNVLNLMDKKVEN
jgi:hypothetical protein